MEGEGYVVYVGSYPSVDVARDDFEAIEMLKKEKFFGEYDSALFEKTADGKVKILNTDATQRFTGGLVGGVAGAVVGLFFPAFLAWTLGGMALGAIVGNFAKGFSRSDIKEIGEALDAGQAGIILVAETTLEEGIDKLMRQASKVMQKEVRADRAAVEREAKEMARAEKEAMKEHEHAHV